MSKKLKLWGELSDSDTEEKMPVAKPPIPLTPLPFKPVKFYQPCLQDENESIIDYERYHRISQENVENMIKYTLRQILTQYGFETTTNSVMDIMVDVVKQYYSILLAELRTALHKCPPSLHPNLIYVSLSQYLTCLETSLVKVSNTDFKTLHDFAKKMYELPNEISIDASSDENSIDTSSDETSINTYETSIIISSDEISIDAPSDGTPVNTSSDEESSSSKNSSPKSVKMTKNYASNKIFQNKSHNIYKAKKLVKNAILFQTKRLKYKNLSSV